MAKETLSIDLDTSLIERVHRYSAVHGKGVSETVSELIEKLPDEQASGTAALAPSGDEGDEEWVAKLTPTVRSLLGVATGSGDEEDYHRYLLEKYGR
jgi:Family of unknown function (DUF6364)